MVFRVSGLYSGLDTDQLVSQLMAIERRPLQLMQDQQHTYELRKDLWNEISSSLSALQDAVSKLKTADAVVPYKVTSSDATVATGTVTDPTRAVPGTYTIEVYQLATAHRVWSKKVASGWTVQSEGVSSFVLNIQGTDITVEADDTLEDIAQRINAANLQVHATVVDSRLYLEHNATGSGNQIVIGNTELAVALGLVDASGNILNQDPPKDAEFTINGIGDPSNPTGHITRSSNTLTDVISGVQINLLKAGSAPGSPATVTLSVTQDLDAAVANIKAWVDKYNATLDLINTRLTEESVKNPTTDADRKKGLLRGDFLLIDLKNRLREAVSEPVTANPPLAYDRLSAIGITTTADDWGVSGKLEVDETKLREALAANPEAVMALFTQEVDVNGDGTISSSEQGIAVRLSHELDTYISSSTHTVAGVTVPDGLIPARIDELQRVIDDYNERIDAFQRVLDQREQSLYQQFTAMEMALSTLQSQATYLAQQLLSWQ